jgi:hypothetical protein
LLVEVAPVSRIFLLLARGLLLSLDLVLALFPGLLAAEPLVLLPAFRPLAPFAALLAILFELFDLALAINFESRQHYYLASMLARYRRRTFCKLMLAKNYIVMINPCRRTCIGVAKPKLDNPFARFIRRELSYAFTCLLAATMIEIEDAGFHALNSYFQRYLSITTTSENLRRFDRRSLGLVP